MSTRIFEVEMEHLRYGINYSRERVVARTAAEAIRKAEAQADSKQLRAIGVNLIAESDA